MTVVAGCRALSCPDHWQEVVIAHPEVVREKIRKIVEGGFSKLQVVADFDRTITSAYTQSGALIEPVAPTVALAPE